MLSLGLRGLCSEKIRPALWRSQAGCRVRPFGRWVNSPLKDFRFQTGDLAHGVGDPGKDFERQMAAVGTDRGARGGINLHQGNLRAAHPEFAQPFSVLLDFLERRFLMVNGRKETLDDHRALPAELEYVAKDFLQGNGRIIDLVQIRLRSGIELHPDFIRIGEIPQSALNVWLIDTGSIRQEDHFEKWKSRERAHMDNCLHSLDKIRCKGRLAIAAQGDMAETKQFIRQRLVPWPLAQTALMNKSERARQFRRHDVHVQKLFARRFISMHFAVNAMEVARFVGIHVDADGQTAGAGGNDNIDKAVIQEVARTTKGRFMFGRRPLLHAFLLLRMIRCGGAMLDLFHDAEETIRSESRINYTVLGKRWTFFAGLWSTA